MKKSLATIALLCAFGAASAQSSVTIWGVLDASLTHGSGTISSKTQLTNSAHAASRLGFRGVEDLGGGMSASFWLEAGLSNDDGQGAATNSNNQTPAGAAAVPGRQGLIFNRRSTVSIAGNWGELRLGRDYVPQFWNLTLFDPFGNMGVGTNQSYVPIAGNVTTVRASNSIGYFLPRELGGFYGQAMLHLGENNETGAAADHDGRGAALRVGYAGGPFAVAIATGRTQYATGDIRQSNIAGSWDFGVAKLVGQYSRNSTGAVDGRGGLIGAHIPVGVGEIRAAYSNYRTEAAGTPSSRKLALGYIHNLSKRTALYAHYARVSNAGGSAFALGGAVTAANTSSSGYDLGLRHNF